MSAMTINAEMLQKMFLSGAMNLEKNKDYINELNVFPVPDGDTGTNMSLTIMSAAKDVAALENPNMKDLCKAMSSGSLRGARGNSGVILSQLIRGFTKVIKEYDELDIALMSAGCDKAVESAYKAVMKPKEGTILTVAKGVCDKANELFNDGIEDLDSFCNQVIEYSREVLAKTPDMLPVLKEAGVVDSGGQGLVDFLQGCYDALRGQGIEFSMNEEAKKQASETRMLQVSDDSSVQNVSGYKTTYVISLTKQLNVKAEMDFKSYLENIGSEVDVVINNNNVNVSLTTSDPGLAIQKGIKLGELNDISVINLNANASNNIQTVETQDIPVGPKKDYGFITVSVGDGIGEVFKNLGADFLIEGGQTMNPSTEDMLNAISKVNADTIFILPNNKNIVMAANQAKELTEDKKVVVIPTKNVPQGISALINFMPEVSVEENTAAMLEGISLVKTGQVTYAVRDTVIEGAQIHQDDYMGIGDSGLLSNGKDIFDITTKMVDKMADDSSEIITIYYGQDVTEEDANKLRDMIADAHSNCDVELQMGGQPIYYYIISVE